MVAVALCIGLFAFWTVVGYAAVTALHASRSRLQDLLIAPSVGLSATVLGLFTFSRLGIPVAKFGAPLAVGLLVVAGVVLWRVRPGVPWRRAVPYAGVLVFALVMTGRPMWEFGLHWVSFCNDDMANYALAGDRFYYHGYFDYPAPDDVVRGKYYGNDFWFMHVASNARPGCELTLAWLRSVTTLNEHQTFMPLILSFHLALLCAMAALVMPALAGERGEPWDDAEAPEDRDDTLAARADGAATGASGWRRWVRELTSPALVVAALLAVSALVTLGTVYQLIAQVSGLALLAANAALVMRPYRGVTGTRLVRHGVLLGVSGAGLLVIYPEVVPFLALAFFGYVGVGLVRRRLAAVPTAALFAVALAVAFALTRAYFVDAVRYMLSQAGSATIKETGVHTVDPQATLFPYYLMPEGLADFWGLMRLAQWENEPYNSFAIATGGLLLLLAAAATAWLCWRGRPVAFLSAAMFALGLVLFRQRSGFGLFKLAMYAAPFALATLALAWMALVRRRPWGVVPVTAVRLAPLLLVAYGGWHAQRAYLGSSMGGGSAFLEIRNPSATRIAAEFRDVVAAHPDAGVIVSDTYNVVIAKFQALYTRGRELVFPSRPFFQIIDYAAAQEPPWRYLRPEQAKMAQSLVDARRAELLIPAKFDLKDPQQPGLVNDFFQTDLGRTVAGGAGDALLIASAPRQSIFNRRHFPDGLKANFLALPYAEARNHLVFVASELGTPYYVHGTRYEHPSLYQIEDDPLFFADPRGSDTIAALGRYLLVQAVNPTGRPRLVLNLTCSYQSDGDNRLPGVAVVGAARTPLPVAGRGAMRVVSEPLEPQVINGRSYYMIDMGTTGRKFGTRREQLLLMNLYGKDLSLDRRVVVGFARDIALVSEEQYARLAPPSRIDGRPEGFARGRDNPLRHPDLEFSGLYEDGWTSEYAYVRLTQPPGADRVVFRGAVPNFNTDPNHKTKVTLSVDGQTVAETTAGLGEFRIEGAVPPPEASETAGTSARARTVRVQFAGPLIHLPSPPGVAPDNRPVAAQVLSIGFEPPVAQR